MLLASLLHTRELFLVESRMIDVSPIVCGAVHRETRRHSAIGPYNDVVLACAAVPFRELQFAIGRLFDARRARERFRAFAIFEEAVAVPAILAQIPAGGHADKSLDLF